MDFLENKKYIGKNIFAKCPFCGKDQKFNYTYESEISNYGMYNCFVCNENGNGKKLLDKLGINPRVDYEVPRIPLNSFIEKERPIVDSNPKLFIDNGSWEYKFPVINQYGEEVYVKIIRYIKGDLNKKGKLQKDIKFIHKAMDGRYYWGKGGRDSIFYGINKLKKNSEIVFIFEGEKKRDRLENCLNEYFKENDFSVISPINGCKQELDVETLSALETASPRKIVLIPDLDSDLSNGFKFVKDNNSILLSKGFNSFIYNLAETLVESDPFDGYDIYDALETHEEITVSNLINICRSDEYLKFYQQKYLWDKRIENEIEINTPYINQSFSFEFLYDELKKYKSPCLIIKSNQGTGKTTLLKEIVESNIKLLYISSRVALCMEVAKQVGIKDYKWVEESEKFINKARIIYSGSLAVCIDSVSKFDYILKHLNEYIVVFDEVDSTIKTLLIGTHIFNKYNRHYIRPLLFGKFVSILNDSKMTICMSSDIPKSNLNLLQKIKGFNRANSSSNLIFKITNSYKDKKKYVGYYYFENFFSKIIELLSKGIKVSISVNSKREINKLEAIISKGLKNREIKILKICSVKTVEVLTSIKNKDFSAYDCIIYSPTIFTGNDFNVDFSDYHFMYSANNRTTDHYELLQSCFRFRRSKEIHFHFSSAKSKQEINEETIKRNIIAKSSELAQFSTSIIFDEENELFLNTYCEAKSEFNNSRNDLERNFIDLVKSRGALPSYNNLNTDVIHDFKKLSKEFKLQYDGRISKLPIIANKNRLLSIKNGSPALNEDEKDAVDKSEIYHLLSIPREISSSFVNRLVTKSSPRKVKEQILNNITLISEDKEIIEMDTSNQDILLTDEITKFTLSKVLRKSFQVLFNLYPEDLKPESLKISIPEVVIESTKNAELGNLLKNDLDFIRFWKGKKGDVSYFIRHLFNETLGWKLIEKQGSNRKIPRSYSVNLEGLALFLDAACKNKRYSN